jgi:tRNA (guanine37-N1)-methyltransferase
MADAVSRLIPAVLGNEASNQDESHSEPGKMGHPQYTKPAVYKSWEVPEVLRSGNHKLIEEWRKSN